jgi:HSP90 family molecular chaperone
VSLEKRPYDAIVTITDNGIGMAKQQLSKIWQFILVKSQLNSRGIGTDSG